MVADVCLRLLWVLTIEMYDGCFAPVSSADDNVPVD